MKRYDLITNYRCGSSIEEMEPSDEGEWMRYEDHATIIAGYEQRDNAAALKAEFHLGELRALSQCWQAAHDTIGAEADRLLAIGEARRSLRHDGHVNGINACKAALDALIAKIEAVDRIEA